jgi:hypothetical protein
VPPFEFAEKSERRPILGVPTSSAGVPVNMRRTTDTTTNDQTAIGAASHPDSTNADSGSCDPNHLRPTEAQYRAYLAAYEHFNLALFNGRLPHVVLTLAKHARSLGYFAPRRWGQPSQSSNDIGEIALNPEHLRTRSSRDSASTLVHEMVHVWQESYGSPSRRGYHNKQWADEMERVGLMPSDTAEIGGKRTGQRVSHYVIEGAAFDRAFAALGTEWLLPFVSGVAGSGATKGKGAARPKYECGCGQAAWGKPGLLLICAICKSALVPVGGA